MTSVTTVYYLCRSEDVQTGVFGNTDQCAYWYLTYGGNEYRIYPKLENHSNKKSGLSAPDALDDEGNGQVWYVAFKSANDYLFREAPFTVVGKDEKDACHALWRYVVESKLLNAVDGDDEFYMIPAEQALPSLIRRAEMRDVYDFAGQPDTCREADVVRWFCNAEYSREALLNMVDILSRRLTSPFTAIESRQIKKQIAYAVVDQGMRSQTKATCSAIPVLY